MPLLNNITTPYAEAFLQVAESRNEVEEVVSQSKSILDLCNSLSIEYELIDINNRDQFEISNHIFNKINKKLNENKNLI